MENTLFPLQQQQTLQTVTDIPKIRNASTIRNRNNAKVKRDRNSKSCDNCRKRKVRCNANIQSPCNYCVKDGIECQFLSTRKKMGPPSRRYTDSLEKRVQMLEKLLDEERNNSRNKEVVQSAYNLPIQPSTVTYVNNHNAVFSCPIQYQSSIPTIFLPTASPSLSPASIIELSQDLRDDSRDYIFDLIQEIPGLTLNLTEYMIESCFTGFTHSGSLAINKYEFLTQYYYQYPRPLDKYLFYAVCAVGCHLLPIHLKNQKAIPIMGRLLRKKAMGVMTQSYTRSNITTVETMIILSLLAPGSESSEGSSTSWLILGAAIRMGQDMGLLYDANLENLSRCEIQNRRRIAYALYTLDKFFSAACGKPFVIRDDDFNVELPLLYEIEPDNGFIANRPLPRLLEQSERDIREARPIYNEIAQLYSMARTICRILMTFYVPNPIPNSGFGSDLDTNLIEWQTKVETSIADKETDIRRVLYAGVLLLRYRPFTGKITNEKNENEAQLSDLCRMAANNIVDSLETLTVPDIPSTTDGLISLATSIFLRNCNHKDPEIRSQAHRNLRRCVDIYMRDKIGDRSQNAVVLTALVEQMEEADIKDITHQYGYILKTITDRMHQNAFHP